MKIIGKLGMMFGLVAGLGFANTWNAKLIDASCYDAQKETARKSHENIAKVCAPTEATTAFAIRTSSGKVYKVDSDSNPALAEDLRKGALKKDKDGDVHASVTGSVKNGVLKVNSVVVPKSK
jgi:hypothetical protein